MNQDLNKILCVDLEATCWEPDSNRPRDEVSEIIEVGITVVDLKTLRIEENEGIIVKPTRSSISKFCTSLTTLTQAQVDKGVSFGEACDKLRKHYRSRERTWVSWGDYDRNMFNTQCREIYQDYPFGPRHMNLKNQFAVLHGLNREFGTEKAMDHIGLSFNGTLHRGQDDSKNIAMIFVDTIKRFRGIK
jgi:inhibitor of KinA sporulation pathway (predicted exonuclease)